MQLVIVESPAKAKTIEKYLGKDFKVLASYGHVRDLPPKDGSVRPDEDFAMDWETYRDKAGRVKEIADAAKKADRLILATDPDREGEAISWHVQDLLAKRKALPKNEMGTALDRFEQLKASIRANVEHPLHLVKNLFRHRKTRYRGLARNEAQLFSLFGFANLVLARKRLFARDGVVAP